MGRQGRVVSRCVVGLSADDADKVTKDLENRSGSVNGAIIIGLHP